MFQLKDQHYEAFSEAMVLSFIEKTEKWVLKTFPQWSSSKKPEDITAYIKKIIIFADKFDIHKENNIQRLLAFHIECGFSLTRLENYELYRLTEDGVSESKRVEGFCNTIALGLGKLNVIEL